MNTKLNGTLFLVLLSILIVVVVPGCSDKLSSHLSVALFDDHRFFSHLKNQVSQRGHSAQAATQQNRNKNFCLVGNQSSLASIASTVMMVLFQNCPGMTVTDFETSSTLNGASSKIDSVANSLENDKLSRPDKDCGRNGSVVRRMRDCSIKNKARSHFIGKKQGQDGAGDWNLVVRLTGKDQFNQGRVFEVWRDERTKLIWSDSTNMSYNWFQSAGFSSATDTRLLTYYNAQAGSSIGNTILQPINPISVCANADRLNANGGTRGITRYRNPAIENQVKGNLNIAWRLPSRNDWFSAFVDGISQVISSTNISAWTATSTSGNGGRQFKFFPSNGAIQEESPMTLQSVRCVAHE